MESVPIVVVPGTYWKDVAGWAETYALSNKPMQAVARIFGSEPVLFDWSGANSASERHAAALALASFVDEKTASGRVHLLGFSHGGNVASEAAAHLGNKADVLVTIATPVTGNYRTGAARRHINLYSPDDRMQVLGGEGPLGLPGLAEREFAGAVNVAVADIASNSLTGSHGNILWSDQAWTILEEMMRSEGLH